ncbi:MAG: Gfo/Idh/MocA family oxidoreductase [Candidatus Omnitrophica bacterium]|nr:Gfo/Idh/MocA family oxidoreductase [Candidatus Omnitrophota bacterium]
MEKVKIGIIGAGGITQYAHIPCFQKLEGVEVVAICDPNELKLKEVTEKSGIPQKFTDYQKLVSSEEIDAVIVCTPNAFHREQAVAALRSGKHVLCEKPVALNSKEANEILKTAEEKNKKFMVAFCHRFDNTTQFLKKSIDRGEFGEIYYAKASYLRRRGIPGLGGWFTTKKFSGGGPLIDCGVHMLDTAIWLMGSPEPVEVIGSAYNKFKTEATDGGWPPSSSRTGDKYSGTFDVEDLATSFIKFANGATLFLEASWAGNSEQGLFLRLFGTKSGARVGQSEEEGKMGEKGLKVFTGKQGDLMDISPILPDVNPYEKQAAHFIECIRENKEPITKPKEILNVVKIIEAIYLSAEKGEEVKL